MKKIWRVCIKTKPHQLKIDSRIIKEQYSSEWKCTHVIMYIYCIYIAKSKGEGWLCLEIWCLIGEVNKDDWQGRKNKKASFLCWENWKRAKNGGSTTLSTCLSLFIRFITFLHRHCVCQTWESVFWCIWCQIVTSFD